MNYLHRIDVIYFSDVTERNEEESLFVTAPSYSAAVSYAEEYYGDELISLKIEAYDSSVIAVPCKIADIITDNLI